MWSQTGPCMAVSITRERQKPQETRKRQFQVKRLKSQGTYLDLQNQVANSQETILA